MSNTILQRTLWFVFCVLLQGLVLNHINFLDSINPYLYVLFILKMPANVDRGILMLIGFALGMSVDVMSSTPGIHASATTLLAFLKPTIESLFVDKDDKKNGVVASAKTYGLASYIRYVIILVLIHHFTYFMMSAMNLEFILTVVKNTLCSVCFTLLLIAMVEYYNVRSEKR